MTITGEGGHRWIDVVRSTRGNHIRNIRILPEAVADSSRLVRVATAQHGWHSNTGRIMAYLFDDDGNGCDAVSPAGYFNFEEADHNRWNAMDAASVTPEMVIAAVDAKYDETSGLWTRESAKYANQYGVDYCVYEGGQHMQPWMQGEYGYNQAVWDAQIHPAMYDLYMKNFACHTEAAVGCDLFVAFSYIGERESRWGSWGHLENLQQLADMSQMMTVAPKYQALLDANTPKRALGTSGPYVMSAGCAGRPVSLTVAGAGFSVRSSTAGRMTVRLFGLDGRVVAMVFRGNMKAGETRTFNRAFDGLRCGTVVVRAECGSGSAEEKFVVR